MYLIAKKMLANSKDKKEDHLEVSSKCSPLHMVGCIKQLWKLCVDLTSDEPQFRCRLDELRVIPHKHESTEWRLHVLTAVDQ